MLTMLQRQIIANFFNKYGYVLNFSDKTFATFTIYSAGVDIKEKYKRSKGASLEAYILNSPESDVINLTKNLIDYFDNIYGSDNRKLYLSDPDKKTNYSKILEILDNYSSTFADGLGKIDFSNVNNDGYLKQLIDEISRHSESNPSAAIGECKDLLEAILKRILEHYEVSFDSSNDMNKLIQKVNKVLNLNAKNQDKRSDIGSISAKILGNLTQVELNLTELRNHFGSGHGRGHFQEGAKVIPQRYANLAIGSTSTVIDFLVETMKHKDAK